MTAPEPTDVEILRAGYESLQSGGIGAMLASLHPEFELQMARDGAGTVIGLDFQPVYRGPAGMVEFRNTMAQAWGEFRWEAEEFIEAPGGIVVFVRFTGEGRASGAPAEFAMAHVCTLRDGRLIRLETFWDRQEALAAAGLTGE